MFGVRPPESGARRIRGARAVKTPNPPCRWEDLDLLQQIYYKFNSVDNNNNQNVHGKTPPPTLYLLYVTHRLNKEGRREGRREARRDRRRERGREAAGKTEGGKGGRTDGRREGVRE